MYACVVSVTAEQAWGKQFQRVWLLPWQELEKRPLCSEEKECFAALSGHWESEDPGPGSLIISATWRGPLFMESCCQSEGRVGH